MQRISLRPHRPSKPSEDPQHAAPLSAFSSGVGDRLRTLLARQGKTLERLAATSGLDEKKIAEVANGEAVPSLGILWKIANALGVPVGSLISARPGRGTYLLKRTEKHVIASSDGRFTSRALFPHDCKRLVEFYELTVAPDHAEHCYAHAPGTMESLVVGRGSIEVTSGREPARRLEEGDAIVFEADVPHIYRNPGPQEALLYLVMSYVDVIDA